MLDELQALAEITNKLVYKDDECIKKIANNYKIK